MALSKRKLAGIAVSIGLIWYVLQSIDVSALLAEYASLSWGWIALTLAFLAGNLLGTTLRLHRLLVHFGSRVGFLTSLRANAGGLLSSLVMISLVGTVVGRQFVLRHAGILPAQIALISGYERVLLTVIGSLLGALGLFWLIGFDAVRSAVKTVPILEMLLALSLSAALTVWLAGRGAERHLARTILQWRNLLRVSEISGITLATQALAISTYVLGFRALGVDLSWAQLVAGAAVVSFVASIPISINGWGVRELASVQIFGLLGIAPHEAVAVSLLVGLCSTVAVLSLTPLALRGPRETEDPAGPGPLHDVTGGSRLPSATVAARDIAINKFFAVLCGLGAAVFLFFQVRATVFGNAVTVNLADPIALSALVMVALSSLWHRTIPIRMEAVTWAWISAVTLVVGLGFLNGALDFGVTPWALSNRVVGWIVLMGYMACGALIASQLGGHGRRVLFIALACTAVSVLLVSFTSDMLVVLGALDYRLAENFYGFSANRNTFALQLLFCLALAVSVLPGLRDRPVRKLLLVAIAVIAVGIWQTGSKLGLAVALVILACGIVSRRGHATSLAKAAALGLGLYAVIVVLPLAIQMALSAVAAEPELAGTVGRSMARPVEPFNPGAVEERTVSIRLGLELWLQHPIFGAGLGAAIRQNLGFNGAPLVIHSTPIWILAEFGLVGMAVVLSLPVYLLWRARRKLWDEIRQRRLSRHHMAVLGVCGAFALFGLGHEIAYQRLFWLLFGAFAASAITSRSEARAEGPGAGRG